MEVVRLQPAFVDFTSNPDRPLILLSFPIVVIQPVDV